MEQLKLLSIEPWWVHCVGLFQDGSVRKIYLSPSVQNYCYTFEIGEDLGWRNVKSLSSSRSHLVGLTDDGRVQVESGSSYCFKGVEAWHNAISISAGYESTAGILGDGTLIYSYNGGVDSLQCDRKDVKAITLCARTVYGVDGAGTLFRSEGGLTKILANDCDKIIKLGVLGETVYGLTTGGDVKVLYGNDYDMENWSCIVKIASSNDHLLGLTNNGKVLWKGKDSEQIKALNPDSKIVDIFAGCYHSLAMNESGFLFSPKNYWLRYW